MCRYYFKILQTRISVEEQGWFSVAGSQMKKKLKDIPIPGRE
jgi:hypothetical protein